MTLTGTARETRVSNVYGHGFDGGELARLRALGFDLRPEVSTYPGSQVCSFLDFARGPALELIEVGDERQYLDFAPPGMEPYCPGISLVAAEGSLATLADLEREFADCEPYRLHVGYDGSTDAGTPGWNYLNFGKALVPGTFIWFTTFDEPRPTKEYRVTHGNGVVGVTGLVFDLQSGALRRLFDLAGASVIDGVLRIGDLDVWARDQVAELPAGRDKAFPLVAVVLEAMSLDRFSRRREDVIEITFMAEPALLVVTNKRSWDLVVQSPAERRGARWEGG